MPLSISDLPPGMAPKIILFMTLQSFSLAFFSLRKLQNTTGSKCVGEMREETRAHLCEQ